MSDELKEMNDEAERIRELWMEALSMQRNAFSKFRSSKSEHNLHDFKTDLWRDVIELGHVADSYLQQWEEAWAHLCIYRDFGPCNRDDALALYKLRGPTWGDEGPGAFTA